MRAIHRLGTFLSALGLVYYPLDSLSWDPERRRKVSEVRCCHIDALLRGGTDGDVVTPATLRASTSSVSAGLGRSNAVIWWWTVPLVSSILSFWSFHWTSVAFHSFVQWATQNSWTPSNADQLNLQTNVVTQVVNGPVITSISVLFASLISMTISNLHSRQVDIQRSLFYEVHAQRLIYSLLESPSAVAQIRPGRRRQALDCLAIHSERLLLERTLSSKERTKDPHAYVESNLLELIHWCQEEWLTLAREQGGKAASSPDSLDLLSQVKAVALRVMNERSLRWLAVEAMHFPTVHYLTLSLLALSISISFLVATAQAEFLFLHGLPVRILWSVLMTSFTALAVVCYDLAKPFGGAYRVMNL